MNKNISPISSQQKQLEVEFPAAVIQQLPKGGRNLDYVPVAEVIQRLNDVLGVHGWSYVLTDTRVEEGGWLIAQIRITATIDGVEFVRDGIGGHDASRKGIDRADGWKSATSEALKKAAQAMGVGLHLARNDEAIQAAAPKADKADVARFVEIMKSSNEPTQTAIKAEASKLGADWSAMSVEHFEALTALYDAIGQEAA
jgi:hypothetical protein